MMHVKEKFQHLKVSLEAINLATDNLLTRIGVGGGGFGKVYKAQLLLSGALTTVALKRLDPKFGQGNPEFWEGDCFCDEKGEKILVYEYASRGSLDTYLDSDDLNWIQRLKICIGAARGLAYLHKPGETYQRVLHRDIKSSNILLDENWNARIADLGLCKFGPANQQHTFLVSNAVGTIGYCDPLYAESGLLTKESDVYSFGVVLFEVLCGRLSISYKSDKRQPLTGLVRQYYEQNNMGDLIHANLKDEIMSRSLEEFNMIAYPCLSMDIKKRPKMAEVVISLERALQYQGEVSESMQSADMEENTRTPDLEYKVKENIGDVSLPSLDGLDISSLQILRIEELEELKELSSGKYDTLYHAKWRGTDVAIIRIRNTGGESLDQELRTEFWRAANMISKLHHPNVTSFCGVVKDGPGGTLGIVTEFMVDGSLRGVLLRKDGHLDHRKKLIIAMDAAYGMEYVHSKNVVHFDLKCDNLFVNMKEDPSRSMCKVGGFGLSSLKRNTLSSGGVMGTLPWMAPELLNGDGVKVSEKVDVFSFGVVLWEILTGEEPYGDLHYGAIIGGIVNNTLRPPIPKDCDPEWRRLMEQCWDPDPLVRPSFTEITRKLRVMSTAVAKDLS